MTQRRNQSLGDQKTHERVGQPVEPADGSLGEQSTYGDREASSLGELSGRIVAHDSPIDVVDLAARYVIEGHVGQGGMGEVLLATDTRLKRKVAIKRVHGAMATNSSALARFATEAQAIAALSHPHIVQIYDYGRDQDGPFLIMEYVDGGSLLERCRDGALPVEQVITLACQLCDGLAKAHDAGIIHRDIKPANILLTKDGHAKLTDFGLAKAEAADHGMTMTGAVLGTLDYMAPEQRRDASLVDARSDLWSLAATLYQMATGKSPKVIRLHDLPKSLQTVLGKALEDEKEDRYQTAREFKEALQTSQSHKATGVDLAEGDCPHCGATNPTNRKFCRECANSLEVPCLSCAQKIPMWETVCDHCGTKQRPLLEQRRQQMAAQQSEAETRIKNHDFDGSAKLAIELRDESDLRLRHLSAWAERFLTELDETRTQELARIGQLVREAKAHQAAYDYAAGLRALETVPEILATAKLRGHRMTVNVLRTSLQRQLDEVTRLERLIRDRIAARELNDLLPEVNRLLGLQPSRTDLQQLRDQLTQREAKLRATRDEAYAAALKLFAAHDYENCLKQLARIDTSLVDEAIRNLQERAGASLERIRSLRKTIAARVSAKQLAGLLDEVEECLNLQPNATDLKKLHVQLRAQFRQIQQRDNAFNEARKLLSAGNAIEAMNLLCNVQSFELTAEQVQFKARIEAIVAAELELAAFLKVAEADGVIELQEAIVLLDKACDYLKLNPHHAKITKLQEDVLRRLRQSAVADLNSLPMNVFQVLVRDMLTRAKEVDRPTLWTYLIEAVAGHEEKLVIVMHLSHDMSDESLSLAIERLGASIAKVPPENRREIGLRFVETLNSLHRSPAEFSLRLDRLRRVQRLIGDLQESQAASGNVEPFWSPIERLNAWLRVPEIIKQAEWDASRNSIRRGETQGDLQYRVGKQLAETLSRALPHGTQGETMSTHEKAMAMYQVLQYLHATELVSIDWRNRAAYYLEYHHWHDAAGSQSAGSYRKNLLMIAGGFGGLVAVLVLGLLFSMSSDTEVAKGKTKAAGSNPPATSNSTTKPARANLRTSVVPPPVKPLVVAPPTAPPPPPAGEAAKAEQDLNSLPDEQKDKGAASQAANVEDSAQPKPMGPQMPPPLERDWEIAEAPLKPEAKLPIYMPLPPVGASVQGFSPETLFRWVIWSQENVRLDATPLVVHGLKEATATWRATKPGKTTVSVEEVQKILDGTPIRATDSDGTQYEIAKFFVHRAPGKVTLEMKLLNGISRNLFEIQRQLFFCIVEFSDTTGRKHFVSLMPPAESAAVPVDWESIKNGNLTSSTGLDDRILRPEAGGDLQRLFVARATLKWIDDSTVSVGGRSWREAPEHEEWPLKYDGIDGLAEGTKLGVRWAVDAKRSSLCVYTPKYSSPMLDQEISDLKARSQTIWDARRQLRNAKIEENEAKRMKQLLTSIERLAKVLDLPVKKFPDRPNPAGAADKRREVEAAFSKEVAEFDKWVEFLGGKADDLKAEIDAKIADAIRRKADAMQRHANAEKTLKERAKSIEAELFRVVTTKDGRRIRVPVMVYPSKDL
ncbi:MAG: protein kinase [Pirellulales bacterium]